MRFAVIDVETANARLRSICQVGVMVFDGDKAVESHSQIIDPQDSFGSLHTSMHGINADRVAGHPHFEEYWPQLVTMLSDLPVVSHGLFDRSAVTQACEHHGITPPEIVWINSQSVARRTWPDQVDVGYGLQSLATRFAISFQHHDALEDARAAGLIMLKAMQESGISILEWPALLLRKRSHKEYRSNLTLTGSADGPLTGETCVFTGTLSMPRKTAAEIAAGAGANVTPGVTSQTTLVIVGEQDIDRLAGKTKSEKHLKAERMAAAGHAIRILTEADFLAVIAL